MPTGYVALCRDCCKNNSLLDHQTDDEVGFGKTARLAEDVTKEIIYDNHS